MITNGLELQQNTRKTIQYEYNSKTRHLS
jgi:hypothetical protein